MSQQQSSTTASQYGLSGERDEEGNIKTADHTFEWDGQEVTIKLKPPTLSQYEEYEDLGDDASVDEMETIVDRHVIEPDIPATDMTLREVQCYIEGIIDYGMNGGGNLADQVREELEQREASGNSS